MNVGSDLLSEVAEHGHFRYESGDHGDTWLDLDALVSRPGWLRPAAEALAEQLRGIETDLVCGPLEGGAFVAQWVAAALGARFAYTAREPPSGYSIPGGFEVTGQRAVVVDDAINVGSATMATAGVLANRGAVVVAVASLLLCLPAGAAVGPRLGVPQLHLITVPMQVWPAERCRLCADGLSLGPTGPASPNS